MKNKKIWNSSIFTGLLLLTTAVNAAPDIYLTSAAGNEGDIVALSVMYTVPETDVRKPSTLKLSISYDPTFIQAGQAITGRALGQGHSLYVTQQPLVITPGLPAVTELIIAPAKQAAPISNGEIAQIPFRLRRADELAGQPPYTFIEVTIYIDSVEMSDGTSLPANIATNGVIGVTLLDSDNDGVPDYLDEFPNDPTKSKDTDNDGIDDSLDDDIDGDGIPNTIDPTPTTYDPNADSDGDGISNIDEYNLGLNPGSADTDGDGMPDPWEIEHNLKPLDAADAALDPDADGLTNLQEYQNKTDPNNPDTDADGVSDGDEVAAGTDPTVNIPAIMTIIQQLLLD